MKNTWHLLLLLFLLSCGESTNQKVEEAAVTTPVQPVEVDENLKKHLSFRFMDREEEPLGQFEPDLKKKATSLMVQVYEFDPADMLHVQAKNRCRAWVANDTLRIALSAPYAGAGVDLHVINGHYTAHPYTDFAPDLVLYDENGELPSPPQVELQSGRLALDRKSYEVGDSLFGHLYLRALIDGTAKHYIQGYFRAKIEKR